MAIDKSKQQRFSDMNFEKGRENLREIADETSASIQEQADDDVDFTSADDAPKPHPDELDTVNVKQD